MHRFAAVAAVGISVGRKTADADRGVTILRRRGRAVTDGETVRLFTRRGHDWTDRYPPSRRAAAGLRAMSFTLDGEAVVAGADGVAVFDALHRRGRVTDAILQP